MKESENARINPDLSYYLIGDWWHKAIQDGEHMYTHCGFKSKDGKTNTMLSSKIKKKKKKACIRGKVKSLFWAVLNSRCLLGSQHSYLN